MIEFGGRLRAERERLGLTQEGLANSLGVAKRTLINYEQGARSPDAEFLAAAAGLGMDVLFALTGRRSQQVPATQELPPRVRALVDNYENTDEAGKKIIEATATAAAQPVKTKRA